MDKTRLIEAALRNPINRIILDRLPTLGLNDAWLVSGAVFQTVWNTLTGRPPDYGIKDYDILYFDNNASWEAEDAVIRRAAITFSDIGARIELRNQGRVHFWYPEKFGVPYPPLQRATEAIDRFLAVASQVGMQPVGAGFDVYASHGFDDIAALTIRPNRCPSFSADLYEAKAAGWKTRWPELKVLPATGDGQPTK